MHLSQKKPRRSGGGTVASLREKNDMVQKWKAEELELHKQRLEVESRKQDEFQKQQQAMMQMMAQQQQQFGKGGFKLPKAMQPRTFVQALIEESKAEGLTNQRCHILSNTKARKLERQKEIEAKVTFVLV